MPPYSDQDSRLFSRYFNNVSSFVDKVLCGPITTLEDYIRGTEPVQFYEKRFREENRLVIEDHRADSTEYGGLSYEYAVFSRFLTRRDLNMLVLIGGLGAGKTTAVTYLLDLFREQRELLRNRFECKCAQCYRQPIHIDCLDIPRTIPLATAIQRVLRKVRFELYSALIKEWLEEAHLSDTTLKEIPEAPKILRRLLITNDLARWADPGHPISFPLGLQRPEYHLDAPLLSTEANEDTIRTLVGRYAATIDALASPLDEIVKDQEQATDFTTLVCRFYLNRCGCYHPSNLLVIDNLDQLPTHHIESILQTMHTVATAAPDLPVLIPLRPSSINPRGHTRTIPCMYHYGPHCSTFVLHRLQKYVLLKSKQELLAGAQNGSGITVFQERPKPEELRAFLVATYIYAKIMTAGLSATAVPLTNGQQTLPVVHEDHQFLEGMHIAKEILVQTAETLNALVGTCGRYATEQLARYYRSVYSRPTILADSRNRGLLTGSQGHLRVSFGQLILAMVSAGEGQPGFGSVANIYAPATKGPNRSWPTLAKLRILSLLSGTEMTVQELTTALGTYGIPSEVTIDNLNDLHNKNRLLLWFSTNSDLRADRSADYEQYVSVSEHGLGYLRNVAGDFEYMWYCALDIPEHHRPDEAANFPARLKHFTRLITSVGDTEWRQLMFRRCLASTIAVEGTAYSPGEFFTLWLLYSSLERIMASSRFALSRARGDSTYSTETEGLIQKICDLILVWQRRYKMCYRDGYSANVHQPFIKQARVPLERFCSSVTIGATCRASVAAVIESWDKESVDTRPTRMVDESVPPKEDFVTMCAQYSRGLIPQVREYAQDLDKIEAAKVYFWQYVRGREKLVLLLENSLPTYGQVQRYLDYLVKDVALVVETSREIAAVRAITLDWFLNEQGRLRGERDILKDNCIHGEPWSSHVMDDNKERCNNIMTVIEGVARRLGAENTEHLSLRWTAMGGVRESGQLG